MITFLEGILSFLSPCMLPLLPVYLSFFAGNADKKSTKLARTLAFVAGFTLSFLVLGLISSVIGQLLTRYQTAVNLICGAVMILFGLSILEVLHISFLQGKGSQVKIQGVFSSFLFGVVYPINLTPCIGAFLGSALALAASSGDPRKGALLLLVYSLGLGLPFLLSALIISQLDQVFRAVKRHYGLVKKISGGLLILVGLLIATGLLDRFLVLFS